MELRDVEICLGIQFPELFHTINNSGMMDYLRHSREWIEDKIANDMNYVWRGDFFGEWMGDCWLFAFENLPSACVGYMDGWYCLDLSQSDGKDCPVVFLEYGGLWDCYCDSDGILHGKCVASKQTVSVAY